jgi:hypothetical protein
MKGTAFPKACACALFVLAFSWSGPVRAEQKSSKIEEADKRFTRGVELFSDEDYAAALAEFHWAYNLEPHYAVLYNIAVCYVKLGRYTDALKYYNQYLKDGGDKIPESRSKQVIDEIAYVKSLMGGLMIRTNVDHVTIMIDGNEMGKTPLDDPIMMAAGPHTVELALSGFMPVKEEVTVASGVSLEKSYTLTKDKRTSEVTIVATAPYAKVFVDDREMGKSPWTGDLQVGEHEIKVTAPGYKDALRPIVVHPEEAREIEMEMDIAGTPGTLNVDSGTQGADVWIEEQKIGTIPLKSHKMPPGMYHISISKEGYKGWEGDVSVKEGALTKLDVTMDKTSGKLHPWAFSLTMSLAVAAAAGAGTLGYLAMRKQKEFDDFPDDVAAGLEGANAYAIQQKYSDLADEGKRLALAADICIAVAAVSGVSAVFLAFFTQFRKPESKASIKIGSAGAVPGQGLSIHTTWSF